MQVTRAGEGEKWGQLWFICNSMVQCRMLDFDTHRYATATAGVEPHDFYATASNLIKI